MTWRTSTMKLLISLDRILVLGPLTNVAAVLDRLPQVQILVTTDEESESLAADLQAAQQVLESQRVTAVRPSVTDNVAAEVAAAWLAIDETLGTFAVVDVEMTSSGELVVAEGGIPARILESIDADRLLVLTGRDQPSTPRAIEEPQLLWRTDIGLRAFGSHKRPAVVGDLVIAGGNDGRVLGISTRTGEILWTVETEIEGSMATGVAHEDDVAVLFGGDFQEFVMFRRLVAIDIQDQSVLWSFDPETISPDSVVVSSPAIADGVVYTGTANPESDEPGVVLALDLHSGELAWESGGFGGPSEPLVVGNDLVVGGWDGSIRIYDRSTGEMRWERQLVAANNGIASRPLVSDGVVYVTGDDGSVHALDLASGEVIWQRQVSTEPIPASPVIADGRLIVAELFGGMTRALEPATGEELWASPTGWVLGDPVVVDETVIVGTFDSGAVLALDLTSGQTVWEFESADVVDGSPVIVDDTLIYQAGDLYALDLPDG